MEGQRKKLGLFWTLLIVLQCCRCQDFGYDGDTGPSHWGEQYNTCTGKHQSPINIDLLSVKRTVLPPLRMVGFNKPPDKSELLNNGHTVMLTLDSEPQPTISGGPLHGDYVFSQLHFHWGENDTLGSEDLIDGVSFPLELHMVFFKKMYRSQRAALDHADGLTVLAFFYEVAKEDNKHYDGFTSILDNLTDSGNKASFESPTSLSELLPDDLVHYFTYNGSLTTPPCSEVVTWIDFKQPIRLSHDQLEKFRALQDAHGHHLTHNFRPIQPLGDRVVLFNIESESDTTLQDLAPVKSDDDILPDAPPPNIDWDETKATTEQPTIPSNEEMDNDPDVGIGSVQGIHLGSSDNNHDLDMMSDMPLLVEPHVLQEAQAEKRHNPKMDAAKGKGSSATRIVGLMHVLLVVPAVLVLFS